MSTHNLCFEQKYEKYQNFLSENFHFLVMNFSIYLNRHVFVMHNKFCQLYVFKQRIVLGSSVCSFPFPNTHPFMRHTHTNTHLHQSTFSFEFCLNDLPVSGYPLIPGYITI